MFEDLLSEPQIYRKIQKKKNVDQKSNRIRRKHSLR